MIKGNIFLLFADSSGLSVHERNDLNCIVHVCSKVIGVRLKDLAFVVISKLFKNFKYFAHE